jgi:hypothetical protein
MDAKSEALVGAVLTQPEERQRDTDSYFLRN